jgi:translocation and assembly module TamA
LGRKTVAPATLAIFAGFVSVLSVAQPAAAFDFFGLWSNEDTPPAVSPQTISYIVKFEAEGAPSGLIDALRGSSTLYSLKRDAPPDGESLARRAQRDFGPLVDALWAYGYFDAHLELAIDGAVLPPSGDAAAFARAAEAYRNRAPAPIVVKVDLKTQFKLRNVVVLGPDGRTLADLPPRVVGLKAGDPALAESIRAAEARIVDYYRSQSRPLAKVTALRPVVDHPANAMDVSVTVDPGAIAGIGEVTVHPPPTIPESVIRSFVYLQEGEPYSPELLERQRTSLRTLPAVGSARFKEKSFLDPNSNLPLDLEVMDRPQHAFGASAQYSTIDGPLGQVYWEDRNLFGGAEYLRLQADLLYAPPATGGYENVGGLGNTDLGGRLSAHFVEPALGGTRNDLLVDTRAEHVSTNFGSYVGYTVSDVDGDFAIRHRFSDQLSAQAGVEAGTGMATDVLGTIHYTIIGVPIALNYDSTNDRLDPTKGWRATMQGAAYPEAIGSTLDLFTGRASVSAYQSIDDASRFVVAGRLEAASESGASLEDIPANLRYYAGGGGSVRGYAYYSLGPTGPNNAVIGGRSLVDGSLELRAKVTDTIGLVPFFDAGNAFSEVWPSFSLPLQMSAGLGLRYYTSLGPLRLDVAFPLNPRPGDDRWAIYVGIGQAF